MNKTKKVLSPSKPEQKTVKQNRSNLLWIIPSIIIAIAIIVGILFDQLYERPLITIDGEKYRLSDVTYYIYDVEATHAMYANLYSYYGMDYWENEVDEESSMTMRDFALDQATDNIVSYEVLYREALEKGYTLTEEEKEEVANKVNSVLKEQGLSKAQIRRNGFTKKYLKDIISRITLADRLKQDIIDSFDIDDAAIEATFSKDEYKQYDFEYFFISTETMDDENNTVAMSDEEKKVAYDKIKAIKDTANSTEDWSTILTADEKELTYSDNYILADAEKESTGLELSDDVRSAIKNLKKGETSSIIEAEDGYYLIRLIDDESYTVYNEDVQAAITAEENKRYQEEFDTNIITKHTYEKHYDAIDKLTMGSITVN